MLSDGRVTIHAAHGSTRAMAPSRHCVCVRVRSTHTRCEINLNIRIGLSSIANRDSSSLTNDARTASAVGRDTAAAAALRHASRSRLTMVLGGAGCMFLRARDTHGRAGGYGRVTIHAARGSIRAMAASRHCVCVRSTHTRREIIPTIRIGPS